MLLGFQRTIYLIMSLINHMLLADAMLIHTASTSSASTLTSSLRNLKQGEKQFYHQVTQFQVKYNFPDAIQR
jgi:hypothetical protein